MLASLKKYNIGVCNVMNLEKITWENTLMCDIEKYDIIFFYFLGTCYG